MPLLVRSLSLKNFPLRDGALPGSNIGIELPLIVSTPVPAPLPGESVASQMWTSPPMLPLPPSVLPEEAWILLAVRAPLTSSVVPEEALI